MRDTKHKEIFYASNFPSDWFVHLLRKNSAVSPVPKALKALFIF